jgi:uncharacterized protein (DUF983 family)
MFQRGFRPLPRCAACGLAFDRNESDYFIGAFIMNLIVAELIVVGGMLIGMYATWPDVPWNTMKWTLLPLAVLGPLITFPFSKSVWLAIDLIYRPATAEDFREPGVR